MLAVMTYGVLNQRPLTAPCRPVFGRLTGVFGAGLLALLSAGGLLASPAIAAPQDASPSVEPSPPLATSPPSASPSREAAYRFVLAKMLAAEGDLEPARAAFQEALALVPEEPYLRLEYAAHLIRLAGASRGNRRQALLVEARSQAEAARDMAGDEPAVWRTLSEVYYDLSQNDPNLQDDARRALERVVEAEPDDLESSLTLGQIYLNSREPEKAAEIFSRVAERTAANRFVYSLLAEALMRTGRLAEAEEVLSSLLALDPTSRQVRLGLASLKSERGDHEAALETLRKAPKGLRQQADVRRRIALELLFAERPGEAREILDPLYAAEPDSPALLGALVLVMAAQGEDGELHDLLTSIDAADTQRRELAALLAQHGQTPAAERLLRQTLLDLDRRRGDEATKTAAAVRFQLADLLSTRGQGTEAAELVEPLTHRGDREERREVTLAYVGLLNDAGESEEALRRLDGLRPPAEERPMVEALRVEVLLAAGREPEAKAIIRELVSSGEPTAIAMAARAAQAQQRYDLAIPLLEPLAAGSDVPPDALFLLAAAYERTGRRAESVEVFERLLAEVPNHHPALNYLGYMWAEQGENLGRALKLIRRAVAAQPEQGSYLDSLGWVHHQLGDNDLALGYLQRAAKLVGDEPEIQKHLGDVQSALGNAGEARRAYRRALELTESGNAEAQAELTRKLESLEVQR